MKPQMLAFSEHGMTDSEITILKSGYKLSSEFMVINYALNLY